MQGIPRWFPDVVTFQLWVVCSTCFWGTLPSLCVCMSIIFICWLCLFEQHEKILCSQWMLGRAGYLPMSEWIASPLSSTSLVLMCFMKQCSPNAIGPFLPSRSRSLLVWECFLSLCSLYAPCWSDCLSRPYIPVLLWLLHLELKIYLSCFYVPCIMSNRYPKSNLGKVEIFNHW